MDKRQLAEPVPRGRLRDADIKASSEVWRESRFPSWPWEARTTARAIVLASEQAGPSAAVEHARPTAVRLGGPGAGGRKKGRCAWAGRYSRLVGAARGHHRPGGGSAAACDADQRGAMGAPARHGEETLWWVPLLVRRSSEQQDVSLPGMRAGGVTAPESGRRKPV
jgi:hypothetical protein